MDARGVSEVIRNYSQIIAILVAAAWTYYVFYGKEAPLLEERIEADQSLSFRDGLRPGTCKAIFYASFKNTGVRAIDIKKLRIRAWGVASVEVPAANAIYYDFSTDLMRANLITDMSYQERERDTELAADIPLNIPFVGRYPAGVGRFHTFEWDLPKLPAQSYLYVRMDLFRERNETKTPWYLVGWGPIMCEKSGK
jgi:hypothetical protein